MIVGTSVNEKPTIGNIKEGDVFRFESDWYMVVCMSDGWDPLRNDHDEFLMSNAYIPRSLSDNITAYDNVTAAVRLTDGEVYYFKDSWKVQECGEAKVSITI
jgi:hypothetical protein